MPLERNVSYAMSAQQALAEGYRPCLRCRPDSAPQSCAWQGVNTTVQRAMHLLNERLTSNLDDIAASLGISTRYLNKLFQTHLQMSPKRFRLYQQVLLAKSLLQQTKISVEEVAFNVGFTSARQLQQHVKTYLKLTPSEIRKNQVKSPTQLQDNVSLLLQYRPPYNWPQVRDFFANRIIKGNESVSEFGLQKVLRVKQNALNDDTGHEFVDVAVSIKHDPKNNGFQVQFNAEFAKYTLAIIAIIKRLLDLDADPQIIASALIKAGLLPSELVSGLRIPGVASEFEAGCRAILGQQVSVKAAINKLNTLYEGFLTTGKKQFTSPHTIANSKLDFLKMPGARKQSLIDLAVYYSALESSNTNAATNNHEVDALINIKGIGPWTINYIKLRALGDTDVWLNTDLIIKQQVQKLADQNRMLVPELAAPWRSYLTLNLWQLSN